jgi:hypothetical protein
MPERFAKVRTAEGDVLRLAKADLASGGGGGGGSTLRYATVVVAAADSLHPEDADFVCDGVDDHLTIADALAANNEYGTVQLMDGTYQIAGPIGSLSDRQTLQGMASTHLDCSSFVAEDVGQPWIGGSDPILWVYGSMYEPAPVVRDISWGGITAAPYLAVEGYDCVVSGCTFQGNDWSVVVTNSTNVSIVGNVFNEAGLFDLDSVGTLAQGNTFYTSSLLSGSTKPRFLGNLLHNASLELEDCYRALVSDCVWDGGYVSLDGGTNQSLIVGNQIVKSNQDAFFTVLGSDNVVASNMARGPSAGWPFVVVDGGYRNVVSNNVTTRQGSIDLVGGASYNKILGNVLANSDITIEEGCEDNVLLWNDVNDGMVYDDGTGTIRTFDFTSDGGTPDWNRGDMND